MKTGLQDFDDFKIFHSGSILSFIPCHSKYSQSEFRKAVVYLTVFNSTFPSCAAYLIPARIQKSSHGIKQLCNTFLWYTMEYPTCPACVYRTNPSDTWDNPRYTTRKRCVSSMQSISSRTLLSQYISSSFHPFSFRPQINHPLLLL